MKNKWGGNVERKTASKQIIKENPELVKGFGCLGISAFVSLVIAIIFLSKVALSITIISSGLCWMIMWTLNQKLKEKLKNNE